MALPRFLAGFSHELSLLLLLRLLLLPLRLPLEDGLGVVRRVQQAGYPKTRARHWPRIRVFFLYAHDAIMAMWLVERSLLAALGHKVTGSEAGRGQAPSDGAIFEEARGRFA